MRSRTVLFVLCALFLSSCSGRHDDARSIPEEAFVRLYADILIHREEETLRGARNASTPDSLCRAYGTSAAAVDSTLKRYQADLPTWKRFHERVKQRLELLQQEMASKRVHR